MKTQQTQLDSLCLYLYERPLHPELFEIFREIQATTRNYESNVWITGCSHVVAMHTGAMTLCEVVDDEDAPLPGRGRIMTMPFTRDKSFSREYPCGLSYTMNLQVESMSRRVYWEMHKDLIKLGAKRGNFVAFPQWRHKDLVPFTYLSCEARPNRLHSVAFHAFPANRTVTKVQSVFELK
jgi:hypothetical protein